MELDDTQVDIIINSPNKINYICQFLVLSNFDTIEHNNQVILYLKDAQNNSLTRKYIKDHFFNPINITYLNGLISPTMTSHNIIWEINEGLDMGDYLCIPVAKNDIPYSSLGIREKSIIDLAIKRIRKICTEKKYREIFFPSDGISNYVSLWPIPEEIRLYIFSNLKFYFT